MISAVIKEKIEAKYGKRIRYSKDCDALASDILHQTKQSISGSTVKRLFGFVKSTQEPRIYTLDVIAVYLGYGSFDELIGHLVNRPEAEKKLTELTSDKIDKGQKVKLQYDYGKELIIECTDDLIFEVLNCTGKHLHAHDVISFGQIQLSYPLFFSEVKRYEKSIGSVTIGQVSGITNIELID